jgi:hypothetical protein
MSLFTDDNAATLTVIAGICLYTALHLFAR